MNPSLLRFSLILFVAHFCLFTCQAQEPTEVREALGLAVNFFRTQVANRGGYVYQYSSDLSKREGEGAVGPDTIWIQPPATPAVGQAYLTAYQYCRDPLLIDAAKEVAQALIWGQLESGGWDNQIEFSADERSKYRYRNHAGLPVQIDEQSNDKKRNTTTFDDNKSQSACRFLMNLDQALAFEDDAIHEAVMYALNAFGKAQYANGAWPQRYTQFTTAKSKETPLRASFPKDWPRKYPAEKYGEYYTLNDQSICDTIVLMLDAWFIYEDPSYLAAAQRGGDFLILAQLPEPQPGWAQQYDQKMHPAWARKFEPPAVTGGESQAVIETLMTLYRRLAIHQEDAVKYLRPVTPALDYYRRSVLPNGKLARFYELETNRPLFFDRDYNLTYEDDDLPTHYSFIVSSKIDRLQRQYDELISTPVENLGKPATMKAPRRSSANSRKVKQILDQIDSRGAWVEKGRLKYHGSDDNTAMVISTRTFSENIILLAEWLGSSEQN